MNTGLLGKYRIGVLAGGASSEREVSLKSGRSVCSALRAGGADAVFLDVCEENCAGLVKQANIDLAFIALHGRFGEDGGVQAVLDEMDIPYTGSAPEPSRKAMDKLRAAEIFRKSGLNTPDQLLAKHGTPAPDLMGRLPCVIKPRFEGSSVGLSVVLTEDAVEGAMEKAYGCGEDILIEDFIEGREITVGVLDDGPLPVVEIVPAEGIYDYAAKYSSAYTKYICPADLGGGEHDRARGAAVTAHNALGCEGFSRVDMRLTGEGEVFVLEVNTIPGLTERSLLPMAALSAGLDFPRLCVKMLENALRKNRGDRTARATDAAGR